MSRIFDFATSALATAARLGAGIVAEQPARRPGRPLELYEFEACPFCRKVREALTELDLEVMIYPCPKGGKIYRPRVKQLGGKEMYPFLVDPNTGVQLYESADIVGYLFKTYGGRAAGPLLAIDSLANVTSFIASSSRAAHGHRARPSRQPEKPLEMYGFEASPLSRIVRETLCELETPYLLHNIGKGSPSREEFVKRTGQELIPWLIDSNTGASLGPDPQAIRQYLIDTYGT
ncbi:MAG: glutathione S-transferase N-terminal domain-containing protein [Deltaproteobacteria bacterium]|nr:glutathione S-transferase N-terminal domain-containing protein [Deltaproteobacteria bacterium]